MKITTFLFSPGQATADDLLSTADPWARFPSCPALEVTPADLSVFGERLGLGARDALLLDFSLIAGESQHPPWVISLPGALLTAIGKLGNAQIEALDTDWAGAGRGDARHDPAEVTGFLASASRFIREHGKEVVLYVVAATDPDAATRASSP